jgi:hypothetical protein
MTGLIELTLSSGRRDALTTVIPYENTNAARDRPEKMSGLGGVNPRLKDFR